MFQWLKTYRSRILAGGCYVVYTLVLTLFFLYLTFPYGRIEGVLLDWVNHKTPFHVSLGAGSFLFPVGFQYDQATVDVLFQRNKETVRVEDLECRVSLFSLIRSKVEGVCLMGIFGGNLRGRFQMESLEAHRRYFISTEGKDLNIGFFKEFVGETDFGGNASVFFDHSWQDQNFLAGKGNASIRLTDVSVRNLTVNGFPVEPLQASQATGRITVEGGKGTVEEVRVTGDMVDIDGTGNFLLRTPATSSLVNLNLNVSFKGKLADNEMLYLFNPNKKKGESFRVTGKGTLGRIEWLLDGMSLAPLMTPFEPTGNP